MAHSHSVQATIRTEKSVKKKSPFRSRPQPPELKQQKAGEGIYNDLHFLLKKHFSVVVEGKCVFFFLILT